MKPLKETCSPENSCCKCFWILRYNWKSSFSSKNHLLLEKRQAAVNAVTERLNRRRAVIWKINPRAKADQMPVSQRRAATNGNVKFRAEKLSDF
ncbi:MAG: hypothetical protein K9N49_08535 [Candidatus Marinimicrobia bacterium]|nr:hypothetical protein [Candidatus Neomarinimicrobiota bacterium]